MYIERIIIVTIALIALAVSTPGLAQSIEPERTVEEIIQASKTWYAEADSYRDTGMVVRTVQGGWNPDKRVYRRTFSNTFTRTPRFYEFELRVEGNEALLPTHHLFTINGEEIVYVRTSADEDDATFRHESLANLADEPRHHPFLHARGDLLAQLLPNEVPEIMYEHSALGNFERAAKSVEVQRQPDEDIDGVPHYVLQTSRETSAHGSRERLTVWINQETDVLRRFEDHKVRIVSEDLPPMEDTTVTDWMPPDDEKPGQQS